MRSIKLKRSLSAATAAIMALSVLTGTAPGTLGKLFNGVGITASADYVLTGLTKSDNVEYDGTAKTLFSGSITGENTIYYKLCYSDSSSLPTVNTEVAWSAELSGSGINAGYYRLAYIDSASEPAENLTENVQYTDAVQITKKEVNVTGITAGETMTYTGDTDATSIINATGAALDPSSVVAADKKDDAIDEDKLSLNTSGSLTYTLAAKGVGARNITVGGYELAGESAGNYTIKYPNLTTTVTAKSLTLDPDEFTVTKKVGIDAVNVAIKADKDGITDVDKISGDVVSINPEKLPTAALNSGQEDTAGQKTFVLTPQSECLTGTDAENYSLTGAVEVTGTVSLTAVTNLGTPAVNENGLTYGDDDGKALLNTFAKPSGAQKVEYAVTLGTVTTAPTDSSAWSEEAPTLAKITALVTGATQAPVGSYKVWVKVTANSASNFTGASGWTLAENDTVAIKAVTITVDKASAGELGTPAVNSSALTYGDDSTKALLNSYSKPKGADKVEYAVTVDGGTAPTDSAKWSTTPPTLAQIDALDSNTTGAQAGDYEVFVRVTADSDHAFTATTGWDLTSNNTIATYDVPVNVAKATAPSAPDMEGVTIIETQDPALDSNGELVLLGGTAPEAPAGASAIKYAAVKGSDSVPADSSAAWKTAIGDVKATSAGTWHVFYKVFGDANHENAASAVKIGSVTVGKASFPTAYLSTGTNGWFEKANSTITYTGEGQQLVKVKDDKAGEYDALSGNVANDITYAVALWTTDSAPSAPEENAYGVLPVNAGKYDVYIKATGLTNYNDITATKIATVEIGKATVTLTPPVGNDGLVPTSSEAAALLTSAGSCSISNYSSSIKYAATAANVEEAPTNGWTTTFNDTTAVGYTAAGDYKVWYKLDGDTNVNAVAADYITVHVAGARASMSTSLALKDDFSSKTYTESGYTLSDIIKTWAATETTGSHIEYAVKSGDAQPSDSDWTTEDEIKDTKLVNAGAYHIYYRAAAVTGDNPVEASGTGVADFTITKATASIATPATPAKLLYSGKDQTLFDKDNVFKAAPVGGTLKFSLDQSDWSTDVPMASTAGSRTVYYKVVPTAATENNYNASDAATINVTIVQPTITFTVGAGETLTPKTGSPVTGSNTVVMNTINGVIPEADMPAIALTSPDDTKVFAGWFKSDGSAFDFRTSLTTANDTTTTLTAKWSTKVEPERGAINNVASAGYDGTALTHVSGSADSIKIEREDVDGTEQTAFNEKANDGASTEKVVATITAFDISAYNSGTIINNASVDSTGIDISLQLNNGLSQDQYDPAKGDRLWVFHQKNGSKLKTDVEMIPASYDSKSKTASFKLANTTMSPFTLVVVKDKTTSSGGSSVSYETATSDGITYNVYDDHAEVAEVSTSAETAVIKDKVGGKNVTVIGANAFNSCKKLTSVTIPATVKTIENSAFWGCSALTEVTIPKSVTSIDKDAFKKCTALKTVYGVKGSAAEKFAEAANLTFKEIGAETLEPSAKVTNIEVKADGTVTWDAAENAVEYKVFKKIGSKIYYTGWTKDTTVKFASLPTVNFEVYVASRNADKKVTYSDHVKIEGTKPLGTAANVTVTDAGKVTWTAAANAKYHQVVKVVNGKYYVKTVKSGTSTTISVPVGNYKVYVKAIGQYNTSTKSEVKSVTVKNALGYVNKVTVDKDGDVSWAKASNAVAYKVAKIMNGKTYWTKKTDKTSVKITPAKKDYQVYVVAFNKDGKKTWGTKNLVSVTDPGTVIDPTVSGKTVKWTAVKNAVKYKVNKVSGGKTYGGSIVTGTSYTFKNAPKSGDRIYVVAYDASGKKTLGWSVTVK